MIPAPFESPVYSVRPDWIDANGHLNLAYYLVLFDWGTDDLWIPLGLGHAFRALGYGTFAAESHILYKAELLAGENVTICSIVLSTDAKRLHVAHEMRRVLDGSVVALQELMYLSVDLGTRRVTPFPAQVAEGLRLAVNDHSGLERPGWVGRRIAMPFAPLAGPGPTASTAPGQE